MYKRKEISKKLILSFILVALTANIAGCMALAALLNSLEAYYRHALTTYGFVQGDIGDYNTYLNKGGSLVRDVIMFADAADIKEVQAELTEADRLATHSLEDVRRNCHSPRDIALLKKIDNATPKYIEARSRAIELGLQNRTDEALVIFRNEASPYLNECMTTGQELRELYLSEGNTVSSYLTTLPTTMMIMIFVMTGCTIATIICVCIIFRSIF